MGHLMSELQQTEEWIKGRLGKVTASRPIDDKHRRESHD